MAPGGVIRSGPDPVRRVLNGTDVDQTWLMVDTPAVGTVEDFGESTTPTE